MSAKKAAASGTGARFKFLAAVFAAAGAGLILISDSQPWAEGMVSAPVRIQVSASGSSLTTLPYALGLVGLAGAVALFAVRRFGRYLLGVAFLAAGFGTVLAVTGQLSRLDAATLDKSAAQSIGMAGFQISGTWATAWPYLTLSGGVLIALAGFLVLARGGSWTGLSSRYERSAAKRPAAGTGGAAGTAHVSRVVGGGAVVAPINPPAVDPTVRDLWDGLNRGADLTL